MSSEVLARSKARIGTVLSGKWHLDGLLGVGGTAAVYAATHRNQKRAAIKILHPELSKEPSFVKRFLREGYVANSVKHTGVVGVLDDDTAEDGSTYIVMELLEGYTLERRLRKETKIPVGEALKIIEDLLEVLVATHEQNILHRDIKPANIFITKNGTVKLLDFGIAKIEDPEMRDASEEGLAIGTPSYMSPEQARGKWEEVDGRSDLFSVGATLWSLITGKKPREASTSNEELVLAMTKPIDPIEVVTNGTDVMVSVEVSKLIQRALAMEAKDRWPNVKTMQQALRLASILEQATTPATLANDKDYDDSQALVSQGIALRAQEARDQSAASQSSKGGTQPIQTRPGDPASRISNEPKSTLSGIVAARDVLTDRAPTPPAAPSPALIEGMSKREEGERLSTARYDALGERPVRPRVSAAPANVGASLERIDEKRGSAKIEEAAEETAPTRSWGTVLLMFFVALVATAALTFLAARGMLGSQVAKAIQRLLAH